ncbi:MAG: type II toxin-antitoxin system VapC family toxin [Acetobacteraceae bacterium]
MRITADTNVLVRAIVGDDEHQVRIAQAMLAAAQRIAVPLPVLCELVWVLARTYRIPTRDIAEAIRRLIAAANVSVNHQAVRAGLAMLQDGGDFADGVIAHEGAWLGADTLVSFDRQAVRLLQGQGQGQGQAVRLLA